MFIVVIHNWREVTAELAQTLAAALEVTVFEARQRLIGNGPAVVASFADPQRAQNLLMKLQQGGYEGFVLDAAAVRSRSASFVVRRFVLGEEMLFIEDGEGRKGKIAYGKINLLLPASHTSGRVETYTVTERKLSLGKTLLAGGLPMTKKVKHQETVTTEDREEVLYLCSASRTRIVCPRGGMVYDGLGEQMKPSREMNFTFLVSELRRRCPIAAYDDRLLKRAGQVLLLGPLLKPEANLDLAVEILAGAAESGRF